VHKISNHEKWRAEEAYLGTLIRGDQSLTKEVAKPLKKSHSDEVIRLTYDQQCAYLKERLTRELIKNEIPEPLSHKYAELVLTRIPEFNVDIQPNMVPFIVDIFKEAMSYFGNEVFIAELSENKQIKLPLNATEIYAERSDKSENPISFLRRVWGEYMDAGILFQDDLKKLGDSKIVQAVRSYCAAHDLCATDILPPPRRARIERVLDGPHSGEFELAFARDRMLARQRGARYREKLAR